MASSRSSSSSSSIKQRTGSKKLSSLDRPKYSTYLKSSSTILKTPTSKLPQSKPLLLNSLNRPKSSNHIRNLKPSTTPISKTGESSKSKFSIDYLVSQTFRCDICVDRKPIRKRFLLNGCSHYYCSDCVCKYVTSKIDSNIIHIPCPASGCKAKLDPKHCQFILPQKVFDKWGDALCEATISPSRKFYCPFKDCSALLIKGSDYKNIVKSECPICHRLFCAQCKVSWHSGIKCEKFQKYERQRSADILFEKLAKKKKWTQCSKCKFYVEKTEGCLSMKCRCGYTFCYNCGSGRIENHYCYNCKH